MKDAVKIILYDTNGRLLALRRSGTHPWLPYHFDPPGGDVDEGENIEMAVIREVREETGIELHPHRLRHAHEKSYTGGRRHTLLLARIDEQAPAVTISWEHDIYHWLSVDDFLQVSQPPRRDDFLEMVRDYLAGSTSAEVVR